MHAELYVPPWLESAGIDPAPIDQVLEGSWAEAATDYAADWRAKRGSGKRGPVGVQRYLNTILDRRFVEHGWTAYSSTYTRDRTWWRITFRHQMSVGSNFLEAMKAVARHDFRVAIVAAATREFLELISPADAPALSSFEKLQAELNDLDGVTSLPIVVAALHPVQAPSPAIMDTLLDSRRRR